MKVGLVYDHEQRPETTGFYCRRALGKLVDVEHLVPHELALVNPSTFDLFVFVDDGLDYNIPEQCRPRAAWAIDTHLNMARSVERFGDAEFLFAAQQNGAMALQQITNRVVHWLPLACDPDVHHPMSSETKCFDLGFVGNPVGTDRQRLLGFLAARYPSSWFGKALFEDMCRMYSRCRIGFNCSVADDLNMRVFEIPACGLPLVTNHIEHNGLEQLFDVGRHLLTFRSDDQLIEIIDRLLNDSVFAEQLARDGHQHVLQHHTYSRRMSDLLRAAVVTKSSVTVHGKSCDYFEFDRPDVRSLIPKSAVQILDIGCASGRLGQCLKSERDCHVTGVEADPKAVVAAAGRLDRVIESPVEALAESFFEPAAFDCIVLADVLEHLRHPDDILVKCRCWLSDSGSLVISVPNSRHHSVVSGLLDGNWSYERAGLLDEDHVRCFTRRELEKLLYRAGFDVCRKVSISAPGSENWKQQAAEGTVQIGNLLISGISAADAEEFHTYQLLVQARKRSRSDFGLTSIIIATFNQLWATRQCVDSLLMRTDEEIELIFVDNGSTDGTPEYLSSIPGARVIRNDTNRGFARAVNQGLQIATGKQLLLLNNDCVVTTGWLSGLLEALYDDDTNGLVGPVSNNVSGTQQIPVSYRLLTSVDGFAWDRRGCRNLTVTDRLVGFCLLFRREVMNRIGLLDEQFEVGCFEDDDFCRRARLAGYRAIIANHVFIHHFGSVTFEGAGFDLHDILIQNERKYEEKWAQFGGVASSFPPATRTAPGAVDAYSGYQVHSLSGGSALLQRRLIRLSLCMIVRDNEETIEACLDSIYPWVDEIIIVDTGSRDRTPEICRRFGARMFDFPWCDDFSAARNVSLEPARGEWIFWMDSDDVIDQEQGRRLRELAYREHSGDCLGYVAQVHCISSEPGQLTIVDHVKLIRNLPEIRFEHRIHEQILPAIRRIGGRVEFTNIFVVHQGAIQSPETRQRKLERDFRILNLDLQQHPDHPFVLFNLGMTHEDAGNYEEAVQWLQRCLQFSSEGESHVAKTYAILVQSLKAVGQLDTALIVANEALARFPDDKELLFRRSILLLELERVHEAAADMERVIHDEIPRRFQSQDPGITSYKALHNLAVIYQQLGRQTEAERCWRDAIEQCPAFAASWIALARHFLRTNQLNLAATLWREMQQANLAPSACRLVEGMLVEGTGDFEGAGRLLQAAFVEHSDFTFLDEAARIYLERGFYPESVSVLQQMRQVRPDDLTVLLNLATALEATGDFQRSIESLESALTADRGNREIAARIDRLRGRTTNSDRGIT